MNDKLKIYQNEKYKIDFEKCHILPIRKNVVQKVITYEVILIGELCHLNINLMTKPMHFILIAFRLKSQQFETDFFS